MVGWWTDPELSIALLRPVSVATHLLDHALAPRAFWFQHLHSLAWYGLSVLVVAWIYRRIHPEAAAMAGLAALLFAVEDAHAMNAGWLANRHAIICLAAGGLAFLAHLRWRGSGATGWLLAALAILAVGLLCGEATLGAAAYLVAWQLCLDRGSWRRRLLGIAPYALLVAAWRMVYNYLGYGISGSDLYVDPGRDPLEFLLALLERWPVLMLGQWLQAPVDATVMLPRALQLAWLPAALLCCAALAWLLMPLLRRSPQARFWALGMAMALVPLCAAFPMDRLLVFAGVGAFALLALLAGDCGWLGAAPASSVTRPRRWICGGLLLLHLPLAALMLVGRTATLPLFGQMFRAATDTAPVDEAIQEQLLIFVTGHAFPSAYLPIIRHVEGELVPARTTLLANFITDCRVSREDEHTLVLEPEQGWLVDPIDGLERRSDVPFQEGEIISMPDYSVDLRRVTADGRPAVAAFTFHQPLEDPGYRWLAWSSEGASPFVPPLTGESLTLPAQSAASMFQPRRIVED